MKFTAKNNLVRKILYHFLIHVDYLIINNVLHAKILPNRSCPIKDKVIHYIKRVF